MNYQIERIIYVFDTFSDEEYQIKSWFGLSEKYLSSPDEMICWIDDNLIEEWNENVVKHVDPFLHRFISDFISEAFGGDSGFHDPWHEFYSSKWIKMRLMAKVIRQLIRKYKEKLS